MTQSNIEIYAEMWLGRISEKEFLEKVGNPVINNDYLHKILQESLKSKNKDDVAYAISIGTRYKLFTSNEVPTLNELLLKDWHIDHENIAWILQALKDPMSIDALYQTVFVKLPYLAFDDNYALAVKCIYGLRDIGTTYAKEKLELLTHVDNSIISKNATARLKEISY